MRKLLVLTGCLMLNLSLAASAQTVDKTNLSNVEARNWSIKNVPYSAEGTTESIRVLPDGNKIKNGDKQKLFRDGQGRMRRESETTFGGTTRRTININDPVAGFDYYVNPAKKIVFRTPILNRIGTVAPPSNPTGDSSKSQPLISIPPTVVTIRTGYSTKREPLGSKTIEGIETTGTRLVTIIAPGTIGNEKALGATSETWFSPELKTIIFSKRNDPQHGEYTFQLTNIKREEPDPSLFEIPADYKIVEGANILDRSFIVPTP